MADEQQLPFALSYLKELFGQWTTKKKMLFGGLLTIVALALFIILQILIDDDYQLLYTNLVPEDYMAISTFLRLSNIEYRENLEQRSIYVPTDLIHRARLELASQKLPSHNGSDLVADRSPAFIGSVTGGDRQIAVQHELSQTLAALDNVRAARVHLKSPSDDASTGSRPGATVLLSLAPGRNLTTAQLQTAIHLVSSSVSGLESGDVKVFDSSGNLLSSDAGAGEAVLFPDSTLSYQTSVERSLERKTQELVDAMIGKGQALIKISATLDFSQNETTSERYDPDEPVVKSEQIERQPITDSATVSGSEDLPGQNTVSRSRSSVTTSSKVDYEISKTTSRIIRPVGELKKLSVIILVTDQKTVGTDGNISSQPRSDEDLEAIRSLVAGILSLDPERGDTVLLRRMDADGLNGLPSPAEISPLYKIIDLVPIGKIILIFIVFVLFYWLLLKPIIGFLRSEMDQTASDSPAPEELTSSQQRLEPLDEDIAVKVKEEVQGNPLAAAHIIKRWIQEA
jgi:flagellar M-ring protein FliF